MMREKREEWDRNEDKNKRKMLLLIFSLNENRYNRSTWL